MKAAVEEEREAAQELPRVAVQGMRAVWARRR